MRLSYDVVEMSVIIFVSVYLVVDFVLMFGLLFDVLVMIDLNCLGV